MFTGNGIIMSINSTRDDITQRSQPTTMNASLTAKYFYCSANSVSYSTINCNSAWFILLNIY